jgi:hypothetical protein
VEACFNQILPQRKVLLERQPQELEDVIASLVGHKMPLAGSQVSLEELKLRQHKQQLQLAAHFLEVALHLRHKLNQAQVLYLEVKTSQVEDCLELNSNNNNSRLNNNQVFLAAHNLK